MSGFCFASKSAEPVWISIVGLVLLIGVSRVFLSGRMPSSAVDIKLNLLFAPSIRLSFAFYFYELVGITVRNLSDVPTSSSSSLINNISLSVGSSFYFFSKIRRRRFY